MKKKEPYVRDPEEWADDYRFATDRRPKGVVGGYAPGDYMIGKCSSCNRPTMGVDKRASQCFACGVDSMIERCAQLYNENQELKEFKNRVTSAVSLFSDVLKQ